MATAGKARHPSKPIAPRKPPRIKRNKTAESNTNPSLLLEQTNADLRPSKPSGTKSNQDNTSSLKVDRLIDFDAQTIIPQLLPPPTLSTPENCLSNVPYDPFGNVLNEDAPCADGILQPTVLPLSNSNDLSQIISSTSQMLNSKNVSLFTTEASKSNNPFVNISSPNGFSVFDTSNLSTNSSSATKKALPNPYVSNFEIANPSKNEKNSNCELASTNPFALNYNPGLNPALPQNSSDNIFKNGVEMPGLNPTAPAASSMPRRDAAISHTQKKSDLPSDFSDSLSNIFLEFDPVCNLFFLSWFIRACLHIIFMRHLVWIALLPRFVISIACRMSITICNCAVIF